MIQKLNESGDSLILESAVKKIKQVDILNEDYLESIVVDSTKGKIDLTKLSVGNYVVQARIGRKWIVMYMEINGDINIKEKKDVLLNNKNSKKKLFDENKMYWVVYESNSQFSSRRTMALKFVDEIDFLIDRIELELKTEEGKYNKLLVFDIYNKPKFIKRQHRNKEYYKSKKSKLFNTKPIYKAERENLDTIEN